MVVDAYALALSSAPLLVPGAVSDVVGILDAALRVGAPHISALAVWDVRALADTSWHALHVLVGSTLAATVSTPDLTAITVRNYALLPGRRPFSSVAAVDLFAARCLPAVGVSLVAHATVTVRRPPHVVRASVLIVGVNGARPHVGVILPAGTAVDRLTVLEIIIPVGTAFADASALSLAPRLRCRALRPFTPPRRSVPFTVVVAGFLSVDAPPRLLTPDLIIVAEARWRLPSCIFLTFAGIAAPNAFVADRAGFL